MLSQFIPVLVMMAIACLLSGSLLLASAKLGPSRSTKLKASPYESGMDPVGTARDRYSIKFYMVAMIFIVFDVEVVFMYPWAVSFKDFIASDAGVGSLCVITVFVVILLIGLLYDFKKGGLEWD